MRAAQRGSWAKQQLHLRSAFFVPIRSTIPLASSWLTPSTSYTLYLTDDDPQLRTRIFMSNFLRRFSALPFEIVLRSLPQRLQCRRRNIRETDRLQEGADLGVSVRRLWRRR